MEQPTEIMDFPALPHFVRHSEHKGEEPFVDGFLNKKAHFECLLPHTNANGQQRPKMALTLNGLLVHLKDVHNILPVCWWCRLSGKKAKATSQHMQKEHKLEVVDDGEEWQTAATVPGYTRQSLPGFEEWQIIQQNEQLRRMYDGGV